MDDYEERFSNIDINQDLKEANVRLNEEFINKKKLYFLPQAIILQVVECIDISLDCSSRLDFSFSPKGTMKILLSDGFSKIIGITKKPIENLNPNISPGTKVIILPKTCSYYGILFLSPDKTIILGGVSPDLLFFRNSILCYNPNHNPLDDIQKSKENKVDQTQTLCDEPPIKHTQNKKIKPEINPLTIIKGNIQLSNNIQKKEVNPSSQSQTHYLSDSDEFSFYGTSNPDTPEMKFQGQKKDKIIDFGDLQIVKRNQKLCFNLTCVLEEKGKVNISSSLIESLLNTEPSVYMTLPYEEQKHLLSKVKEKIMEMNYKITPLKKPIKGCCFELC